MTDNPWTEGDSLFVMDRDDDPHDVGKWSLGLRNCTSALLKKRLDPKSAQEVADREGELLSALAALQMLCSDLRETRVVVPFPRERVN